MSCRGVLVSFFVATIALGCSSGENHTVSSSSSDTSPTQSAPVETIPTPAPITAEPPSPPPKDGHDLTGVWIGDDGPTYTFSSNNTFTIIDSSDKGSMTIAGDYKLDGNRIELNFTLITAKASDPKNQAEADQAVAALKKAMQPERDPIEWVSDNEVVITQGNGPTHKATLKRKT